MTSETGGGWWAAGGMGAVFVRAGVDVDVELPAATGVTDAEGAWQAHPGLSLAIVEADSIDVTPLLALRAAPHV